MAALDAPDRQLTAFDRDEASWPARPIIVVTGGNGGVGYGICQRLIAGLSEPAVDDLTRAFPIDASAPPPVSPFSTPNGLTLVLACRNAIKAHNACTTLLRFAGKKRPPTAAKSADWKDARKKRVLSGNLAGDTTSGDDEDVALLLKKRPPLSRTEYKQLWLANLRVEFVPLDLTSFESTMHCTVELRRRYPYVSQLLCNAGAGPFTGLNIPVLVREIIFRFFDAMTYPRFIVERRGLQTDDGIGWTWQANVFGHYLLARELLGHVARAPFPHPRILFTGSLDGLPVYYDPADPEAADSGHSYQSAKFSCGLLAWGFNDAIARHPDPEVRRVRSFLVHPGVVAGNMFREILGYVLDRCMYAIFILTRMLGSIHHCVSSWKASLAFVYVTLAPLPLLAAHLHAAQRSAPTDDARPDETTWLPMRFGARCAPTGREYVGVDVVLPDVDAGKRWWWNAEMAAATLDRCERLRTTLRATHGYPSED